jgi:hypothetical protein
LREATALPMIEPPPARVDALPTGTSTSAVPAPSSDGGAQKVGEAASTRAPPGLSVAQAKSQQQANGSASDAKAEIKAEIDAQRDTVSPSLPWAKRPPLPEGVLEKDAKKVRGRNHNRRASWA